MIISGDIADMRHRLGLRIRDLRCERGHSQASFAKMIGMDRSYLIGVERRRRNVSADNIFKIAKGLGVPTAQLFDGVEGFDVRETTIETIRF